MWHHFIIIAVMSLHSMHYKHTAPGFRYSTLSVNHCSFIISYPAAREIIIEYV